MKIICETLIVVFAVVLNFLADDCQAEQRRLFTFNQKRIFRPPSSTKRVLPPLFHNHHQRVNTSRSYIIGLDKIKSLRGGGDGGDDIAQGEENNEDSIKVVLNNEKETTPIESNGSSTTSSTSTTSTIDDNTETKTNQDSVKNKSNEKITHETTIVKNENDGHGEDIMPTSSMHEEEIIPTTTNYTIKPNEELPPPAIEVVVNHNDDKEQSNQKSIVDEPIIKTSNVNMDMNITKTPNITKETNSNEKSIKATKSKSISNSKSILSSSTHKNQSSSSLSSSLSSSEEDLPIIESILIPRQLSIPRIIRFISTMLFTSSLLECLRTSGIPFSKAVIDTLLLHNIQPQYQRSSGRSSNGSSIEKDTAWNQMTSFDEYVARKIESSSSGQIKLPPPFLPNPIPLFGLITSLFLYIGVTILFPMWFIQFETWLSFIQVKIPNNNNKNGDDSFVSEKDMMEIQKCLDRKKEGSDNEKEDDQDANYYKSQFVNRQGSRDGANTGLAVLAHLSRQDQEMNRQSGKSHVIRWIYREEQECDDNDDGGCVDVDSTRTRNNYYIELNQRRVYIDIDIIKSQSGIDEYDDKGNGKISIKCRDGGPTFYQTESIQKLHDRLYHGIIPKKTSSTKALQSLKVLQDRYEKYNQLTLPIPTIQKAFVSRITTPLSIMQFMGKILSILEDDSLVPSVMSFGSTLIQHYWNAMRSIVSAKELAVEIQGNVQDNVECMYWTLRPKENVQGKMKKSHKKQWELIPSSKILPGDVFCFPPYREKEKKTGTKTNKGSEKSNKHGDVMPVDALLLEGNCLALEAVITGESVPQAKVALDVNNPHEKLNIDTIHRSSALFAGTTLIQCTNDAEIEGGKVKTSGVPSLPRKYTKSMASSIKPVKCLSLQTGSYSSKGEIIRALSKGKNRSGSVSNQQMDRDSIKLISALAAFAAVSCATLFIPALQNEAARQRSVSPFRRIMQCSRIAVASIPSNLPLALSYVAHSCSTKLRQDADVVCSEPGALLTASRVDMVVFDKTGTLTSDTQSLKKIVPPPTQPIHYMTDVVLAGCHSLIMMEDDDGSNKKRLVGDPLDAASLEYSNWSFNGVNKSASPKKSILSEKEVTMNVDKLWQIKTFPFDPTRRRSASLVLVSHGDRFRLWVLMKGSPDAMMEYTKFGGGNESDKNKYIETVEDLGSKGYRVISMAVRDVSDNGDLVKKIFPNGISKDTLQSESETLGNISLARTLAQSSMSINEIESTVYGHFDHIGFSCFDTFVRPSSARVIRDLKQSGTEVCMLTGDAPDAALSVAKSAQFFEKGATKVSYLLDLDSKGTKLVWMKKRKNHKGIKSKIAFSFRSTESIMKKSDEGSCVLVASGRAIDKICDYLFDDSNVNDAKVSSLFLMRNLKKIKVISRSSPQTKQRVIGSLKKFCNMNVMMCGDGVNDIAAMKTADISAALLTGYGNEKSSKQSLDFENERRKTKLGERLIGNNRLVINKTRSKNQHRTLQERIALQKGGTDAAKILAKEMETKSVEKNEEESKITVGEASLAAPFSFLRPCIDGSEFILRSGVAAAAFSLTSYRSIALNSLMACFNLATLYRNGFRYGKYMWNVELSFIMAIDQGQNEISCTPRPRLSKIRPHQSIFHRSSALSVLLQSICHLYYLSYAHHAANHIEKKYGETFKKGVAIKLANPELFGVLGEMFRYRNTDKLEEETGIFRRRRFRPNHITNTIFILSCFQNTMIALVNHIGQPFNGNLFESRTFCFAVGASVLFCICVTTVAIKPLNDLLQLATNHSNNSKVLILTIMAFNGLIPFIVDILCTYLLDKKRWDESWKTAILPANPDHAADVEQKLLVQERNMNQALMVVFGVIAFVIGLKNVQ